MNPIYINYAGRPPIPVQGYISGDPLRNIVKRLPQSPLKLRRPSDFHIHLRQGQLLENIVCDLGQRCSAILPMPNLDPAVETATDILNYVDEIRKAEYMGDLIMTFKITPKTTADTIREIADIKLPERVLGIAGKLYPDGVTTNSSGGVTDFAALDPVFAEMQKWDIHLLIHGEKPGTYIDDSYREIEFLAELIRIANSFPRLKITLEHITTKAAVETVLGLKSNVRASITAHHLFLTENDVKGAKICPHNFCKPTAKLFSDLAALRWAALSGHKKFYFGSDAAAHDKDNKETDCGCAGCYTIPTMIEALAWLFMAYDSIEYWDGFTHQFGRKWFGMLPAEDSVITLEPKLWIPEKDGYCDVVPWWSSPPPADHLGGQVPFRLVEIDGKEIA